jgi:hypothetical protein
MLAATERTRWRYSSIAFCSRGNASIRFSRKRAGESGKSMWKPCGKWKASYRTERRPLERAPRERVEDAPGDAVGRDLADRVHADVPVVAGALELVREAARHVVLLEHQHAPPELREERGRGHAAHPRADHDVVPGPARDLLAPRALAVLVGLHRAHA